MFNLLKSSVDPQDQLKGAQLARGRTKSRVDALQRDLDTARQTLAELTAQEANSVVDNDILPTASKALLKTQEHARQLEAGLEVAKQRDREAQAALTRAQQYVEVAKEEEALARLKYVVAPKADKLFAEIESFVKNDFVPAVEAARAAGGVGVHLNFLVDLTVGFEMFFLRAARQIIPKGRAHVTLLGNKTFTDLIPDPSTAAKRREVTR